MSDVEIKDGIVSAKVDILNGFEKAPDGILYMAIYSGEKLSGIKRADFKADSQNVFEEITVEFDGCEFNKNITDVKFFFWSESGNLMPVFGKIGFEK